MDWQLPDIGKTITNDILPSSLIARTQYESGDKSFCRSAVVGYFRPFPYRVALFPWIHVGLYIVGTIRFNSMNHVGHVLNYYFNRTNPQWRRRCKTIMCLTSGSTNNYKVFSPGNMWIKNSTIKACKEFVRLPNDEISDEIPRFASVQSNYSLRMELPIHGL